MSFIFTNLPHWSCVHLLVCTLSKMSKEVDINALLPNLTAFMRSMYYIKQDINLDPRKDHISTCINRNDTLEVREDFIRAMVSSVIRYVYSKEHQDYLKRSFHNYGHDEQDIALQIFDKAKMKFRSYDIKGQFTELLLYNLLIYHFKAIPLVRKMSLTTNPSVERHGSDAIHIAKDDDGKYVLYLGEAKTYESGFKPAIKAALKSITKSFTDHRAELNLYSYDKFIPQELEEIAQDYMENFDSEDIEVHLVCIITYEAGDEVKGVKKDALKKIIDSIGEACRTIGKKDYPEIDEVVKSRINYIIFPVHKLDELLSSFKVKLGI